MQALELRAAPPAGQNDDRPQPEKSGDDFDHAMQRALSPLKKETPAARPGAVENKSRPQPCPVSSANAKPTAADENLPAQTENPDGKKKSSDRRIRTEVADAAVAQVSNAVSTADAPPPAVLFSLPLILNPPSATTASINALPTANAAMPVLPAVKTTGADVPGKKSTLTSPADTNLALPEAGKKIPTENQPTNFQPRPTVAALSPAENKVTGETATENLPAAEPKTPNPEIQPPEENNFKPAGQIQPASAAGTGVATDAGAMEKTQNENKVAGLDVQVLPGGTNGSAHEAVASFHPMSAPARVAENKNQDLSLPPLTLMTTAPETQPTESSNPLALPSLADVRTREVERTHELVSINALRMVESKADAVSVVIKPGAGTELSLELRHRNGSVEMAATLQRGDFQLMNQHWPELQQKLEQRGIKLSALGGGENFSTSDNGNFSRREQAAREEAAERASAFAEFTVAMNRGGATARLAPVSPEGWESWA